MVNNILSLKNNAEVPKSNLMGGSSEYSYEYDDPLAEKFSGWDPYTYVFNNPVRFTDPTGMEGEDGVTDPPTKEQQAAMTKSDKENGAASEKYAVRANRIGVGKSTPTSSGTQAGNTSGQADAKAQSGGMDLHSLSQTARKVAGYTLAASVPLSEAFGRSTLYGGISGGGLKGGETVLVRYTKSILGTKIINQPLMEMSAINAGRWATGLKVVSKTVGVAGIGLAGYDISQNGFTTSNTLDLAMSGLAVSGFGTGVAGAYFILNAGSMLFTGQDLGQHIDSATTYYTGKSVTDYMNGR